MKDKYLLLLIKKQARIEITEFLPSFLEDGAQGGFHPCGMWDYICDSCSLEWCGVQFYMNSDGVQQFESANMSVNRNMIRVRKISDVYRDKVTLDQCLKNGTSHVLQVVWTEPASFEDMPGMEFSDSWYTRADWKETASEENRFQLTHEFSAIGVLVNSSKLDKMGLIFPRSFIFPVVDRTAN
jgi:hypothetical protein